TCASYSAATSFLTLSVWCYANAPVSPPAPTRRSSDLEIRAVAAHQLSASPQVGTLLIIGVQHVGAQTTRGCEPGLLSAGQPVYASESVPLSRNRVSLRGTPTGRAHAVLPKVSMADRR